MIFDSVGGDSKFGGNFAVDEAAPGEPKNFEFTRLERLDRHTGSRIGSGDLRSPFVGKSLEETGTIGPECRVGINRVRANLGQ